MAIVRDLVTRLSFKADNSKIKRFDENVGRLSRSLKGSTVNMRNLSNGIQSAGLRMTAFVTAPLALLGGGMIKIASDMAETQSKFDQTFKGMEDRANGWADSFSKSVGRFSGETKVAVSAFQAQALGLGFTQEKAFEMSKQLQTLSVDFASFNNMTDDESFTRFISAMSGSSEVVDKFGINLKQTALDIELMALGFPKISKGATEQQKALARLNIIQKAMGRQGALGDAIRTADSFANVLKRLQSVTKDVGVQFGNIMLPIANKVLKVLIKLVDKFSKMSDATKKFIIVIALIAGAIGPALLILGLMAGAITSIITLFSMLSFWLIPIIGLIALLGIAIGLVVEDMIVWASGGKSLIGTVLGSFTEFKTKIMPILSLLKETFSNFWNGVILGDQKALDAFSKNLEDLIPILTKATLKLLEVMAKVGLQLAQMFGGMITRLIVSVTGAILGMITGVIDKAIDKIRKKFPTIGKMFVKSGEVDPATKGRPRTTTINGFSALARGSSNQFSNGDLGRLQEKKNLERLKSTSGNPVGSEINNKIGIVADAIKGMGRGSSGFNALDVVRKSNNSPLSQVANSGQASGNIINGGIKNEFTLTVEEGMSREQAEDVANQTLDILQSEINSTLTSNELVE